MIICSCRIVCTQKIKDCVELIPKPTVKSVLKELNWTPDCSTCAKNIVKEINLLLDKKNEQ